ncbi:hypothetical protein EU528_14400 [Candidatus Thorarchaeota archaeon]|nr:MAG: hypothetical protein EU528_14400 [Candidatus Thorarchaeota archaeon]
MKSLSITRIASPAILLIVSLILPYWIYGANGRFELRSILVGISFVLSEPSMTIHYIPHFGLLLPSLLICAPCFLWLFMERDMRLPKLLGSAGLVLLALTIVLLLFLPIGAVFPWIPSVIAYVPDFIDLIPFSGLTFTIMVLLPLIWRGLLYPETGDSTLRKKVTAMMLSVSVLLFPMTIETFSWQGSDYNRSFFEGFSLNSAVWTLSDRVDGNRWGEGTWFNFSISSVFSITSLIMLLTPGIIFAWHVCRGSFERKRVGQMLTAGVIHLLFVSLQCIWLNSTTTHAGMWIVMPFPALFVVGLAIIVINYYSQWRQTRDALESNIMANKESLPQEIA